MNIRPLASIVIVMLFAGVVRAETIDAGPFSVDVAPTLTVRCNEQVLFCGDRTAILTSRGFRKSEPSPTGSIEAGQVIRDGNVVTMIARQGRNSLRREIMVTADAVHITYEARVFGGTGGTHLRYELLSPNETLQGVPYRLTRGLMRRPRTTTDEVFAFDKVEPFKYLFQTGLYMAIDSPKFDCTLDFNPMGTWQGINNYGESWNCAPYHDGENLHWTMFCSAASNGATFSGKIIIRPGGEPYETFHDNIAMSYTTDFPVEMALNFTDSDTDATYVACPPNRWRNAEDIRIVPRATGGLLRRDFATSDGEGVLDLALRSGQYLVTLNVYDAKEDTGPFSVASDDGVLLENIVVPRGEYWNKTVPLRSRDGKTELRFNGKWKINALTAQLILRENEDFLFERPYWNMDVDVDAF
jgi:hypothetical protein